MVASIHTQLTMDSEDLPPQRERFSIADEGCIASFMKISLGRVTINISEFMTIMIY